MRIGSSIHARFVFGGFVLCLWACSDSRSEVAGPPGTPLPDLSADALDRYERGKALFEYAWSPEEGLGPTYAQPRCTSCHDVPSTGGTSPEGLMMFARGCDPLAELGGSVLQTARTPLLIAKGIDSESLPSEATVKPTLVPSMLYGLGLIESIPATDILSREDPDDADGDGISGKAGRTEDGRLAVLGRKGGVASIVELVDAALITELGLTTRTHPTEETINGVAVPPDTDPAPDPEVDDQTIALIADFVRYLAPLAREMPASSAVRDTLLWGEDVFGVIGCAACHVPTLTTGPNDEPGLDEKTIRLYSDLLLHDMGPAMSGLCGPGALPSEYRTEKLMGLRLRQSFMHDGRATGFEQAILFHGGEGAASRDAFNALNMEARAFLFRFLTSL